MVPALEEILAATKSMVFFGGAGVSTESGIPDFRSVDGLYHQKFKYPPETMLSHTFYETHTAEFFDFYRQKLIVHGQSQRGPPASGGVGARGQMQGRRDPEHRRPAPGRGQQDRV